MLHDSLLPDRQAILVRLNVVGGKRTELLDLLNTYADRIGEEPGTEVYTVLVDPDSEDIVWLFEVFTNEEAEILHRQSIGFADLLHGLQKVLDGSPGILRMNPLRMTMQEDMFTLDWSF
jgi:quinol monooxygenase YgiN